MTRIVVIGDLHCGSIFGMLPPNFITSEGIPKLQNVGQKYLWQCWVDFSDRVKAFDPHVIVANGDLIDGPQRKQNGSELSLPLLFDQTEAADITLWYLKERAPKADWYFTQGTAYHVGHGAEHEENIAKSLKGKKYKALGPGKYVKQTLFLRASGKIIEFSHHASGAMSGPWNEIKDAAIAYARGYPKVDLMVRNHLHHYRKTASPYSELVNGPAWQLQTGYGRKTSTYKLLPDIGGLFISAGEAIDVRPELYALPKIEVVDA